MERNSRRGEVTRHVLQHVESGCYWTGRTFVHDVLAAAQYLTERDAKAVAAGLETPCTVLPFSGTIGVTIRPNGNAPMVPA